MVHRHRDPTVVVVIQLCNGKDRIAMQQKNQRPHVPEMLASLLLIVLVGLVTWWLVGLKANGSTGNSAATLQTQLPTPSLISVSSAKTPLPSLEPTATPALSAVTPTSQDSVATKMASVATLEVQLTTSPFPTFPPTPTPHAFGIISDEYAKAQGYALGIVVQNAWVGVINGNSVAIWVGTAVDAPDEDVILVRWSLPKQTLQQRFALPGKHDSLKIVAEQNNRLTLTSADKATFYFDVPGLRVVDSLTESVPTADLSQIVTPSALNTPVVTPGAPAYP